MKKISIYILSLVGSSHKNPLDVPGRCIKWRRRSLVSLSALLICCIAKVFSSFYRPLFLKQQQQKNFSFQVDAPITVHILVWKRYGQGKYTQIKKKLKTFLIFFINTIGVDVLNSDCLNRPQKYNCVTFFYLLFSSS